MTERVVTPSTRPHKPHGSVRRISRADAIGAGIWALQRNPSTFEFEADVAQGVQKTADPLYPPGTGLCPELPGKRSLAAPHRLSALL